VEERSLRDTLRASYEMRIRASLLDLEGDTLRPLRVTDGQVNGDAGGVPTRTASVDMLDAPEVGPNRMVRVEYGVLTAAGWVDLPLITGVVPPNGAERQGRVTSVTLHGKESLAFAPVLRPVTVPGRMHADKAIRVLLGEHSGETRFDLGDMPRLGRDVTVERGESLWSGVQTIARRVGRQVFYDGRGVCVGRRPPGNRSVTFRDGNRGSVLSVPARSMSGEDVINVVDVTGGTPKGAKKPIRVPALVAPSSHPLSPRKLGRNGVPRSLPLAIEDDSIRSTAEARERQRAELRDGLRRGLEVAVDVVPDPRVEELDLVGVQFDFWSVSVRLRRWSIGLRPGPMSIGVHKVLRRR
jgi:hypothetical protein